MSNSLSSYISTLVLRLPRPRKGPGTGNPNLRIEMEIAPRSLFRSVASDVPGGDISASGFDLHLACSPMQSAGPWSKGLGKAQRQYHGRSKAVEAASLKPRSST